MTQYRHKGAMTKRGQFGFLTTLNEGDMETIECKNK